MSLDSKRIFAKSIIPFLAKGFFAGCTFKFHLTIMPRSFIVALVQC